jgi:lysophospholipase L1-like esterase
MTARGRFLARLVTTLIALAGFLTVGALPAGAHNSGTIQYVALGDSYAAGQGGGDYVDPKCLESLNGYPYLLNAEKRIHLRTNVACTGASTDEVESKQLSALNRGTRLVTLTVGAADLNLSGVLTACTAGTQEQCLTAIANAESQLPTLAGNLVSLYTQVASRAPNALIVVTGYPYLFDLDQPLDCDEPTTDIMVQINCATAALNATIQQAVTLAQTADPDINIIYVDVTDEFAGHGIGSTHPFINATGPDAYHPNAAGYIAYAEAISAALPSAWLDEKQAA